MTLYPPLCTKVPIPLPPTYSLIVVSVPAKARVVAADGRAVVGVVAEREVRELAGRSGDRRELHVSAVLEERAVADVRADVELNAVEDGRAGDLVASGVARERADGQGCAEIERPARVLIHGAAAERGQ